MDDDSHRMRQPGCVRGIETRSIRCRNGNISFYYREDSFITMTVLDVRYMEFQARHNLYAVWVDVSPITLVVDDFGVKCVGEKNIQHLIRSLGKKTSHFQKIGLEHCIVELH